MEFKTRISLHQPVPWRARLEDMVRQESFQTSTKTTLSDVSRRELQRSYKLDVDNKMEKEKLQ